MEAVLRVCYATAILADKSVVMQLKLSANIGPVATLREARLVCGLLKRWRAIAIGLMLLAHAASRGAVFAQDTGARNQNGDYVVLVHGLGRTAFSMKRLEWVLLREGYRVINVSYPSTRVSVEDAANGWLDGLLKERVLDPAAKIHFVCHSQGGIVLRQYLADNSLVNPGRVVMLAPPNRGSELADKLRHNIIYKFFTGSAGQQLGAGPGSLTERLGPAHFELGIIAGDRSLNPLFSAWIPGPDDGKVSVSSTQLGGMQDFLIVHHSHTWMMWRKDVTQAVTQFLRTGQFER